jgi:Sec-independent protein secretion pathway component TatC
VPLYLLYELSIVLSFLVMRRRERSAQAESETAGVAA